MDSRTSPTAGRVEGARALLLHACALAWAKSVRAICACLCACACACACATTSSSTSAAAATTTAEPREAHVETERQRIKLDASGLHPASSTRTIGDARALAPKLLTSVALERNALTGEGTVEPWLSRVLIAWLVEHGAEVRGETAATSKLVGVRFTSMKQDVAVAVAPIDNEGGGYLVRYWAGDKDMSECAPALKLPLTYVQLEGVLVDANQRFVASFAEVVAAKPPAMSIELDLKGRTLCDAITDAFNDDFAPSESELVKAATQALDGGFRALVGPPDEGPPP